MSSSEPEQASSPNNARADVQPLAPITRAERFQSIDVLRGFALLGILVMNIPSFAFSSQYFFHPDEYGGFEGLDYATWLGSHLFFEMKMMSIFSMLFGAGIIMMTRRADERHAPLAGVYYRRMGWLLLFGLVHAYLIWEGDILVSYALCGMLVYLVRRWQPRTLIVVGLLWASIGILANVGQGLMFESLREEAMAARQAIDAGAEPTPELTAAIETWEGVSAGFEFDEEALEKEREQFLGSYAEGFPRRAQSSIFFQTWVFLSFSLWRVVGMMLLGMGLMKLRVLTAERSTAFYWKLMLAGYALGIPIVALGAQQLQAHGFDWVWTFKIGWNYNYVGSVLVALGHVGLVMLVCRYGLIGWLRSALAAVGRMAFTNYIMQSVICAAIFYGWGFGLWSTMSRSELMLVVLAIWLFQLVVSPLWLARFRFGPLEWLWRSLTYARLEPFRRTG